jgi:hypothetical protein
VDIDFPPVTSSIFTQDQAYPFKEAIVWKRPVNFLDHLDADEVPQILETIEPTDIKRGALDDVWFLSALARLAENPEYIRNLFITQQFQHDGCYRLRICKNGVWHEVTIDDYFPCTVRGGPIFAHTKSSDLWVLLLEKAYAKLHGNYSLLQGGLTAEALMDLTGA